jgi:hypothetical protein
MNISSTELKTMKVKQLRRLIRESVAEVLKEGSTYAGKDAVDDATKDPKFGTLSSAGKTDALNKLKRGDTVTIGEGELDELARLAKGYRLANPDIDSTTFTKSISGNSLASIIEYFRENPGAEAKDIQTQFGFVRPQIAQGLVKGLLDAGILIKMNADGQDINPAVPGEEDGEEEAPSWEDQWVGSKSNPLSMYFDDVPNTDGTEDFNDEEEPTAVDIEPAPPINAKMSDADYEAWEKYNDLQTRLNATKSNIIKIKRSKGGSVGDIKDKPSTELLRLRDLKASIEAKMAELVASSEYLRKKEAGELDSDKRKFVTKYKKTEPTIEPVESEDEIEPEPLDEWTKNKLQYYAGIRK